MATRAEITTKYAKAYKKATKKTKGAVLGEVVAVTGWTRDNARRLTQAADHPPGPGRTVATRPRKPRASKYPYDAMNILQRMWAISGPQAAIICTRQCGSSSTSPKPTTSSSTARDATPRVGQETADDEAGHDRPVPGTSAVQRRHRWALDDEAWHVVTLSDHDPAGW